MRQIDEHAEAIHLANDFFTERRQAVVSWLQWRCGIRPVGMGVVRQRHVANAKGIVGAQSTDGVFEPVAALHAEHRGDATAPLGLAYIGDARGQLEGLRVSLDDPMRDVDLVELRSREWAATFARDVNRPELGAKPPGPQPGKVRITGRGLTQVVGVHIERRCLVFADGDR